MIVMHKDKSLRLPKDFLWGASVSSHQVEGNNHNQWSEWELVNAKALAAQAKHRYGHLYNWDEIQAQATDPNNYVSGPAVKHYQLYKHDFAIAKRLGLNCFRFSLEWSRIEPSPGSWNLEALEHYKNYIKELKAQGLEPVMTLFHFSLPVWFTELGGFEKKRNLLYFNRYVEKVMEHFGGQVKYFITINEPMIYASQGYLDAVWPPQVHSKPRFLKVAFNLIKAHNRVAKIIKQKNRRAKVSIAYHSVYYYSGDDAWLSRLSAAVMQYFSDDIFISRVAKHCDYLGVNYYVSNRVFGYRIHNEDHHISDLGWNLEPANVEYVAERLYRKYKLPIFITENGLADSNEDNRKQWLAATLAAMHRASAEGVPIIGYIHWSLLDNFEWASGKWPKFGLVEVDYKTYKRQVRPSALWLSKFIKNSWSKD